MLYMWETNESFGQGVTPMPDKSFIPSRCPTGQPTEKINVEPWEVL